MKYKQYTPVDPDFYEIFEKEKNKSQKIKVFYFEPDNKIGQGEGKCSGIDKNKDGEFMILSEDAPVRIDRIITFNGKPGPAYDEYDAYANACLSCQAGYDE